MATITLKGNPIQTLGDLPALGQKIPDFELVRQDLTRVSKKDFEGNRLVMNIFPSIDTGICAMSVKTFYMKAAGLENTKVLNISRDLPFALKRFCGAEGIDEVIGLSDFVDGSFGKNYNLTITSGPMKDFLSRAVIVTNEKGKVIYHEQVPEIGQEPNYDAALEVLI